MAVKQTAGREQLGDIAPKFAELHDDVLFGEVWSREDKLSLKFRSIITVTSLISKGLVDRYLSYIWLQHEKMVLRELKWWKL